MRTLLKKIIVLACIGSAVVYAADQSTTDMYAKLLMKARVLASNFAIIGRFEAITREEEERMKHAVLAAYSNVVQVASQTSNKNDSIALAISEMGWFSYQVDFYDHQISSNTIGLVLIPEAYKMAPSNISIICKYCTFLVFEAERCHPRDNTIINSNVNVAMNILKNVEDKYSTNALFCYTMGRHITTLDNDERKNWMIRFVKIIERHGINDELVEYFFYERGRIMELVNAYKKAFLKN